MNRTLLVVLCALFTITAGCSGWTDSGEKAETTTNCSTTELETAHDIEEGDTRSYPPVPAEINRSTARTFASEYERAYAWNRKYDSDLDELHVDLSDVDVEQTDEGYLVHINEVRTTTYEGGVIGDDAWSAHYHVTDSVVKRSEGNAGGPTTPEGSELEWETIHC